MFNDNKIKRILCVSISVNDECSIVNNTYDLYLTKLNDYLKNLLL